jgi:hypothetical protein
MTRVSTFCVVSSTLAVLALSANGAIAKAFGLPMHVAPRVHVHPKPPKGHIDVMSFSWGVSQTAVYPTRGGAGKAGRASLGELQIGKVTANKSVCRHCPNLVVSPTK